jgi:hypothetical protein
MKTLLVTVSDDRFGRKNGLYEKTQDKIAHIVAHNPHFGITDTFMMKWADIQDSVFYLKNFSLLRNTDAARNGRAYKPYAIQQALEKVSEGDFVIYNDCSPEIWKMEHDFVIDSQFSLEVIQNLCTQNRGILSPFVKWDTRPIPHGMLGIHTHENFTTDVCMERMGLCHHHKSFMHASGMMVFQKTQQIVDFVDEWLYFNCIDECASLGRAHITNDYSIWDDSERHNKMGHRHDQSISGLLINKYGYQLVDLPIAPHTVPTYNFLNFCRIRYKYPFIDPNINPEKEPRLKKGDWVKNKAGEKLKIFEFRPENGIEWIIVGPHEQSCYATTKEHLKPLK